MSVISPSLTPTALAGSKLYLIISAPMDTVCGQLMAVRMAEFGALGIVHRYNTIEKQAQIVSKASENGLKNIGVNIKRLKR